MPSYDIQQLKKAYEDNLEFAHIEANIPIEYAITGLREAGYIRSEDEEQLIRSSIKYVTQTEFTENQEETHRVYGQDSDLLKQIMLITNPDMVDGVLAQNHTALMSALDSIKELVAGFRELVISLKSKISESYTSKSPEIESAITRVTGANNDINSAISSILSTGGFKGYIARAVDQIDNAIDDLVLDDASSVVKDLRQIAQDFRDLVEDFREAVYYVITYVESKMNEVQTSINDLADGGPIVYRLLTAASLLCKVVENDMRVTINGKATKRSTLFIKSHKWAAQLDGIKRTLKEIADRYADSVSSKTDPASLWGLLFSILGALGVNDFLTRQLATIEAWYVMIEAKIMNSSEWNDLTTWLDRRVVDANDMVDTIDSFFSTYTAYRDQVLGYAAIAETVSNLFKLAEKKEIKKAAPIKFIKTSNVGQLVPIMLINSSISSSLSEQESEIIDPDQKMLLCSAYAEQELASQVKRESDLGL